MIEEHRSYNIECDNCGKHPENENDFGRGLDLDDVICAMRESGWTVEDIEICGSVRCLCDKCSKKESAQ